MEKAKTGNRRLISIGGSIGVTLPMSFLKEKGWKPGDRVSLVFDDIAVIIRLPDNRENKGEVKDEPESS